MRLVRHHAGLPASVRGASVALGNFDGVHRGHQAVIGEAGRIARDIGAPHGVVTFEPHPRSVFRPDDPPFRLSTLRSKAAWIEPLGVDLLYVLHFDRGFAAQSARDFVEEILVAGLGVRHIAVGENFRFGKGRRGTAALLAELGARHGFAVTVIGPVLEGGEPISSTRLREILREGRVRDAARLLGHPWELEGRVEPGDRRGRTLGWPTANVGLGDQLVPAHGVYAVRAGVDEGGATAWLGGVANVGRRPTVDGLRLRFEVHLFDFGGDLYGRHLRVQLLDFIRPERKFDGLDALKAQIAADAEAARRVLAVSPMPSAARR